MSGSAVQRTPTILLVDDDVELCRLMQEYFAEHGYRLESTHSGLSGVSRILHEPFDLVILDVMLPVLSGFDVLRHIRRHTMVPVVMLTARAHEQDRIAGLENGADDYLPKPFAAGELLARIRAVLRRTMHRVDARPSTTEAGGLTINGVTREVELHGGRIDLTPIEFDILEMLIISAGRVVSRDSMSAMLYERTATPYERAIDVHVSHLRKKLGAAPHIFIHTVRGVGYRLLLDQ